MPITLSDFEYDNGTTYTLDLDCDTLAKLTEYSLNGLSGLFGGGVVGTITIIRDTDASLENDLSDGAGEGEAVGPTKRAEREWIIPAHKDDSDPNVAKILKAREFLLNEYEDPDDYDTYGYRVLVRYAAMLGYRWEIDQLQRYSDFASVYTITPADREKNGTIWEYREIFDSNVFFVDVELKSPIDRKVFSESVGGYIGEEWTLEHAQEMITGLVAAIRQHVREQL